MTTWTSRNAEQCAKYAEGVTSYAVGMCLQYSRICAGASSLYPDASTAARNANLVKNRNPPRGSMVYWTGGSAGHGHIAPSLGNQKVRSSDYPTAGHVGTCPLNWIEQHWGLTYVGWAWDVNEQTIKHGDDPAPKPPKPEEDMPKFVRVKRSTDLVVKPPQGDDSGWINIVWESSPSGSDDVFKKGESYLLLDQKMFTAALSLTAVVDPSIDVIRTRFLERGPDDKGNIVTNETYPALESKNTQGNTYVVDTRVQKCNSKRLVAQVNLGQKGGTLLVAELNLLYF